MNRRSIAIAASMVLVASFLIPTTGIAASRIGHSTRAAAKACKTSAGKVAPAPKFKGATKKYKGATLNYYGDDVGIGHQLDVCMIRRYTKATGVDVNIHEKGPNWQVTYQQLLGSHSSAWDAGMIDVIYPPTFARYLVNLKKPLAKTAALDYKAIVQNDTINKRLVTIPYFSDYGILYYRKDLLKKYGFSKPPKTWAKLQKMAKKIQKGQQKKNPKFTGFVFQGNAYEGLTCNALEWIASYGGGTFVNGKGKVTVDNSKAVKALNRIKSMIGKETPTGVTTYTEGDAQTAFTNGDAAFERNWPYAYAINAGKGSNVKGKFAVEALPHGPGGKSSATIGGWGIGVSKYSKHRKAAILLAKYLSSKPVEIWRALVGGFVTAMPSVAAKKSVQKVEPWLKFNTNRVARPSRMFGAKYQQASIDIYTDVHNVLTGSDAKSQLATLKNQLKSLLH